MLKVYFILGLFVNFTNICQSVQDKEWDLLYILKKENNIHLSDDITLSLSESTNFSQFIVSAKQVFSQNSLPNTFVVYVRIKLKSLTKSPMTIFSLRDPDNRVRFQMKLRMIPGFIRKTELNVILSPISANGNEVNINFTLPFIQTDIWTFGMLFKSSKITLYTVCDDINRTFGYQTIKIPGGLGKMLFSEGAVMYLFSDEHQTDLLQGEIYDITFANFFRKLKQICNQGGIEGSGGYENEKIEKKSPGNHLLVTEKMDEDDTTTETRSTTNFSSVTSRRKLESDKKLIKQSEREKNVTVEKSQVTEVSMNDMESLKSDGKISNQSLQNITIKPNNKKNITLKIPKNPLKEFSEIINIPLVRKVSSNLQSSSTVKKATSAPTQSQTERLTTTSVLNTYPKTKKNVISNSITPSISSTTLDNDSDFEDLDLRIFDSESVTDTLSTERSTNNIETDPKIRFDKSTKRYKMYEEKFSSKSLQNVTVKSNNNDNKEFKMENNSIKDDNTINKAINILTQNPFIISTTIPVLNTSSIPFKFNTNSGTSSHASRQTPDKLNYDSTDENKKLFTDESTTGMSSTEKVTKSSKNDKISLIQTSKESSHIMAEVIETTYSNNSHITIGINSNQVSEGTENKTSDPSSPQETDKILKSQNIESRTILPVTVFPIYTHSTKPISSALDNITHKYLEQSTSDNLNFITESSKKQTKTTLKGSTNLLINTTHNLVPKSTVGKVQSKLNATQRDQTVTLTNTPPNSTIFTSIVPIPKNSEQNLSKVFTESNETGIYNLTKQGILSRITDNQTEFDQKEYTSKTNKTLGLNETNLNGTLSKIPISSILFNISTTSSTRQSESETSTLPITSSTRKVKTDTSTALSSMKLDTRLPGESNETLDIMYNNNKIPTNKSEFYTITKLSYPPISTILPTSTKQEEKTQLSKTSQDENNECSILSKLRLSIPQRGTKGERGLKGDIGEKGERGLSGIDGVCDASICRVTFPSKGDKGDPGQCHKSQCSVVKGNRGLKGFKGNMGQKGEKGESNDINIELIRYLTHSIIKAQMESMALFQNGKGEKGEPGACKCDQKVPDKSLSANDIYEDNVNIGYGSLVFETRELLEQTSNRLPVGSMVYISQSDIFLIKIDQNNNAWRTISLEPKSRIWILPTPINIPKPESTYPPYQNGFSKKLHLIALVTPTMGDLKPMLRQPGGYSGAAFQCQQAGEMYGFGRNMHPFLNTDPFHLKFSINRKYTNLPIINSRGETLASNFNALLFGNDDLQNEILDFKKESISKDILSQCVWLGKEPTGNDIEYDVKTESRCVNWMSREPHIQGLVAFINSTKSLFDEFNRGLLSCSRQCYVLCIQTEPYDP